MFGTRPGNGIAFGTALGMASDVAYWAAPRLRVYLLSAIVAACLFLVWAAYVSYVAPLLPSTWPALPSFFSYALAVAAGALLFYGWSRWQQRDDQMPAASYLMPSFRVRQWASLRANVWRRPGGTASGVEVVGQDDELLGELVGLFPSRDDPTGAAIRLKGGNAVPADDDWIVLLALKPAEIGRWREGRRRISCDYTMLQLQQAPTFRIDAPNWRHCRLTILGFS